MTCHATYMTRHSFRTMDAMTGWLSDDEQAAWRGLLQMTAHLNARLNRELQEGRGLSLADYEVLVRLSDTASSRARGARTTGGARSSRLPTPVATRSSRQHPATSTRSGDWSSTG